jgi:hypothetical protein
MYWFLNYNNLWPKGWSMILPSKLPSNVMLLHFLIVRLLLHLKLMNNSSECLREYWMKEKAINKCPMVWQNWHFLMSTISTLSSKVKSKNKVSILSILSNLDWVFKVKFDKKGSLILNRQLRKIYINSISSGLASMLATIDLLLSLEKSWFWMNSSKWVC